MVNNIFPQIKERISDIKLIIVGRNPTPQITELLKKKGIELITNVPDIRPYIAQSLVYLVPIRFGGGTRLKILDAMSMEKAVVSTEFAANGLKCTDGVNIMLTKAYKEFADKVVLLLKNKNLRKEMGRNAREYVIKNFDWKVIANRQIEMYKKLLR